jgi:hypothetical protein
MNETLTIEQFDAVTRESDVPGITLRESVYRGEYAAADGEGYTYLYTELWSDGATVVKVSIRRGRYPEYSHAYTHVMDVQRNPFRWEETGVVSAPVDWHGDLVSHSQYMAPTSVTGMAALMAGETMERLAR